MPLASAPVEIAGRNRMFRAMVIDAIRSDPAWKNGDYDAPPANGLIAARYAVWMMTSSPLQLHKKRTQPAREGRCRGGSPFAEAALAADANDELYQY